MLDLRLHAMRDESTLDLIRKLNTRRELAVTADSCVWVGFANCN